MRAPTPGAGGPWPATHAKPGRHAPGRKACRCWARWSGSPPRPPPCQRAACLQRCDLGVEQFAFQQHLAQLGFQPPVLQRLAVGGRSETRSVCAGSPGPPRLPPGRRRASRSAWPPSRRARARRVLGPRPATAAAPRRVCVAVTCARPGQAPPHPCPSSSLLSCSSPPSADTVRIRGVSIKRRAEESLPPGERPARKPGRRSREDVALHTRLLVLTTQPGQRLALGRAQAIAFLLPAALLPVSLHDPVADRLGGGLELAR